MNTPYNNVQVIDSHTGGEPTRAYVVWAGDDEHYVRNASAVATKAAAL